MALSKPCSGPFLRGCSVKIQTGLVVNPGLIGNHTIFMIHLSRYFFHAWHHY